MTHVSHRESVVLGGPPELIAERMAERKALGFHTFLGELAAPYDEETLERWIGEVRPMVDGDPSRGSSHRR